MFFFLFFCFYKSDKQVNMIDPYSRILMSWHGSNPTHEHELPPLGGGGWVFFFLGFSGGGWLSGFVVDMGHDGWLGFFGLFFSFLFFIIFMDCCSSCWERKKWYWKSAWFVFVAGSSLYSCAEFYFFFLICIKFSWFCGF